MERMDTKREKFYIKIDKDYKSESEDFAAVQSVANDRSTRGRRLRSRLTLCCMHKSARYAFGGVSEGRFSCDGN